MTLSEKAASLSQDEIVALLKAHQEVKAEDEKLRARIDELTEQLAWLKQQLFGAKSERRLLPSVDAQQRTLGEQLKTAVAHEPARETVRSYSRRSPSSIVPDPDEPAPRFDDSVPVEVIEVPNPEIAGLDPESYDVVGVKETLRLAQKPSSYVLLRYVRQVVKLKKDSTFSCPPAPHSILEKSVADVSLLVGLLIDKLVYHMPLYRQHQRLLASGIRLDRSTLTKWVHRTIQLLEPIYDALWESVLESSLLIMDETPIKAGRSKRAPPRPNKMKTCYFWPIYGDRDEIVFPFSSTHAQDNVPRLLGSFKGKLLTDGFDAYDKFAAQTEGLLHAQCWNHARRYFVKAEQAQPELAIEALQFIRDLYDHEEVIRARGLQGKRKLEYRGTFCKPIVDKFFEWLKETSKKQLLLPTDPLTKAISYSSDREKQLRVFLEYPDVPMDTNQVENEIRPIALGRKNWMFAWTEVGAKYVGIIQSLIRTCKLQGVDPYTYLVDVLQRIDTHPAAEVAQLTPRLWKEHFADQPKRSDIHPH